MASARFVIHCSLLLLALCFAVEARLACMNGGYGCMSHETTPPAKTSGPKMSNRMEEMAKVFRPMYPRNRGDLVDWDLRWVPSGPDPLHHNGTPRKPRTP